MNAGSVIDCSGRKLDLSRPVIMGVLNVTPDSFSDGGKFIKIEAALKHAEMMIKEGAAIIDVGGESSRPGARPVPLEEELNRILPLIKKLKKLDTVISVDTYNPKVAEACLKEGAHIINDITGLENCRMAEIAAEFDVPVIIMHMQGKPLTMQKDPQYKDVVEDIKEFFAGRIEKAKKTGIEKIILDPGIGFGKTLEHNLEIINRLKEFGELGYPLMLGTSRKSFIGKISNVEVNERLEGTIASNIIGLMNGARIFRVHDVAESRKALEVAWKILERNLNDRIVVSRFEIEALVGVDGKERKRKQKLVVDAEIELDLKRAAASGRIGDTVNYSQVLKGIRKATNGKEFVLLESMAKEIAEKLKKNFEASRVRVRVGKKEVADRNKAAFVGVGLVG